MATPADRNYVNQSTLPPAVLNTPKLPPVPNRADRRKQGRTNKATSLLPKKKLHPLSMRYLWAKRVREDMTRRAEAARAAEVGMTLQEFKESQNVGVRIVEGEMRGFTPGEPIIDEIQGFKS